MTIQLECINFIVPIKTIEKKYPGGWMQCLSDHGNIGVWYDEDLFRLGAMNPMDIGFMVDHWKKIGFHTHIGIKNPRKWVDV